MPALAALLPAIFAIISRLLMLKAAMWLIHVMVFLGLAFMTNEAIVAPLVGMLQEGVGGLPADITQWAGALGIDKVISILVSAYTIRAAKRVFLGARA